MRNLGIFLVVALLGAAVVYYFKEKKHVDFEKSIRALLLKKDKLGIRWVRSEANVHFAYMYDSSLKGKFKLQSDAVRAICYEHNYNQLDNCEVYIWDRLEDIPKRLPIIRTKVTIGYYRIENDKIVEKRIMESD